MKKDKKTSMNISITQSLKDRINKINKETGGSINWSNVIETSLAPQVVMIEKYVEGAKGKEIFEEGLRYLIKKFELDMYGQMTQEFNARSYVDAKKDAKIKKK